jgi:poly(A) polymerase
VPDPIVVPRAEHRISRKDIDPEALKVLYRLHDHQFAAYLVGGSVRDLLLGRRPKDFDVGTDAHPYQIKKLFRNCWIIGRRFRLAHVKFGPKTIEVATFRKLVPDVPEPAPDAEPEAVVVASASPEASLARALESEAPGERVTERPDAPAGAAAAPNEGTGAGILHRDNTFGTPEEDAFRRDFTINGLFYDIGTFSVIDYVGGLADLEARVVRSIGDPRVRFVEDPVRMIRAVVMAARLGFDLDPLVVEAIAEHRTLIQKASPARLLEEYYKILRSGSAEATFRGLARARLLELITPELKSCPDAVWDSLARLDDYRLNTAEVPPIFSNTLLIGALLCPLGTLTRRAGRRDEGPPERVSFGMLPVARRDLERLHHLLTVLPRLSDPALPPRVVRGIVHRPSFADALAWLEVFGDDLDVIERWRQLHAEAEHERRQPERRGGHVSHHHGAGEGQAAGGGDSDGNAVDGAPRRRRRRRRRRRGARGPRPAGN